LTEYWNNLPEEHKDTLFSMREEDFVAELDAHMKYQLKVPFHIEQILQHRGVFLCICSPVLSGLLCRFVRTADAMSCELTKTSSLAHAIRKLESSLPHWKYALDTA